MIARAKFPRFFRAFSGAPDHFRRARMVLLSAPHNEEGRLQNSELLPLRHPRLQSVGEEDAFVQSRTHVALLRLRDVLEAKLE